MEDAIVLYSSAEHLNTMQFFAIFIAKHHPSIPITVLSFADEAAAAALSAVPSITYRRIPTVTLPPESMENYVEKLFELPRLNLPSLRAALEEISHNTRIRAFVIDYFCSSGFEVATSLNIPAYFYVSSGSPGVCFFLNVPVIAENISTDAGFLQDFREIPGCPLLKSSEMTNPTRFGNGFDNHLLDLAKNMRKSCGIIANGFDAIDFRAKEAVTNGLCVPNGPTPPLYLVGPLLAEGGGGGGGDHECLRWLDKQPTKSVIFLCFGRWAFLSGKQLREMAVALEKCGYRFLWSVGKASPDLDEGFLARTKDRGFVVSSWLPQRAVLSHDAVAGFVTHCGRSSVLEAVLSGVPMIGWPKHQEQKMNRAYAVEELQVALPLEKDEDGFVTAAELEKRVRELMDQSKKSTDMRRRVSELKVAAAAAVQENGSSVAALNKFINVITRD